MHNTTPEPRPKISFEALNHLTADGLEVILNDAIKKWHNIFTVLSFYSLIPSDITNENCYQKLYDFFNAKEGKQNQWSRKAYVARELLNTPMNSDEEASALIEQVKLYLYFRLEYHGKRSQLNGQISIDSLSEEITPEIAKKLALAIKSGWCELLYALIDLGLHPDLKISNEHTVLSFAICHWNNSDIIKIINHPNYQPTININWALLQTILKRKMLLIHMLINRAKERALFERMPTVLDSEGFGCYKDTLLHLAVRHNNLHIVRLLLENGADPCKKNNLGLAPVKMAERAYNQQILKVLRRYSKWYFIVAYKILRKHLGDQNFLEEDIDTVFNCLGYYIEDDSDYVVDELSTAIYFLVHLERSLAKLQCEQNQMQTLENIAQYVIPCFFCRMQNECLQRLLTQ